MKRRHLIATALLGAGTLAQPLSAQIAETPGAWSALQALGPDLSREMVGATMQLYGGLLADDSDAGLSVTRDLAYGDHARNMLDVYAPEGAAQAPVVVFVHGGGFVRGDKAGAANVGRWFARHGVVAVVMNYRYAPEVQWPEGGRDVSGALGWIRANVAGHGGDPSRVVLMGNSAGAMHVADYTFREDLQLDEDGNGDGTGDGVIGAILISPPSVDLAAKTLDPTRDLLYYGETGDRAAQSVVTALEGRQIPVLVAYAEHEPDTIIDQTHLLIEALRDRDGRLPLIASAPGHNHISIVGHFGTADEALGLTLLDFITYQSMKAGME